MDINDIKHLAVERIFLVPDASEGQLGYVWCDDPAPGVGMDAIEAVEYVRKDVHEARIAELEEREAALAAHVEELISVLNLSKNSHGVFLMSDPPQDAWKKNKVDDAITNALKKEPPNILTCRDLLQRAEELESLAKNAPPEMDGSTWRYLQDKINALHQQVEESGQ